MQKKITENGRITYASVANSMEIANASITYPYCFAQLPEMSGGDAAALHARAPCSFHFDFLQSETEACTSSNGYTPKASNMT